jgi:hypothetical protein
LLKYQAGSRRSASDPPMEAKNFAAARIERAAEHGRPQGRQLQHVVAVKGDVAERGCHGVLPWCVAPIVAPVAVAGKRGSPGAGVWR